MAQKAWNCLIVDDMHPALFPILEQAGIRANYQPEIKAEEIGAALAGYQILVIRTKTQVNRQLLSQAPELRLVARAGAGTDNVDEQALLERGIGLVNAPEGNRDAVAEHTLAMLLCLFTHLHTADRQVRDKVWKREANRGTELGDKTVGIIGYGNMGKAFAKRLSGFGCKVLAYDKYRNGFSETYAQKSTLEQIYQEADVVSLHVPLTPETRYLVNESWLSGFAKPITLLNTSRGEVLQLSALAQALRNGRVTAAALDVLENEKLHTLTPEQESDFAYLASLPQVLFTPHVAGWTQESYARISTVLGTKITEYYKSAV